MAQQLPPALIDSLQTATGFDEAAFIKVHASGEQLTAVRVNPAKINKQQLPVIGSDAEEVAWCTTGFYLPQRPSFTLDPAFHAGAYYVQEASSMFLQQALQQTVDLSQSLKVLDLCAAPGGKSTLLESLLSAESVLISNEVIKTRVTILSENMTKWGTANVIVTNNDPKDFQRLENYFDVIVVDAPCSGSGLFRKDANAIDEWSENNVQLCSQRQKRILADIMPALKEGGVLIYSTCSYSQAEDEAIGDWLANTFKAENIRLKIEDSWGIVETISEKENTFGYRFYPDKVKGEGFFIAAFKKTNSENINQQIRKDKNSIEKATKAEIAIVQPWLKNAADYFFVKQKEDIIALPLFLQQEVETIRSALYIKKAGVKLGTVIRNELIPDHELALSTIINENIPAVEVDKETALQYLRKQDIKTSAAIKGWALIKYQQLPLGWAKILPNRVNNYYPKEWRIVNK